MHCMCAGTCIFMLNDNGQVTTVCFNSTTSYKGIQRKIDVMLPRWGTVWEVDYASLTPPSWPSPDYTNSVQLFFSRTPPDTSECPLMLRPQVC